MKTFLKNQYKLKTFIECNPYYSELRKTKISSRLITCLIRSSAVLNPIPDPPPVIKATRPLHRSNKRIVHGHHI